jgi:exodeoxyribonuclease VIII
MNPFSNAVLETVNTDPNEYHKLIGAPRGHPDRVMSRSEIAEFRRNPARWLAAGSFADEDEDTDALVWGSLVDCLLLTPGQFEKRFVIRPTTYESSSGETKPWNGNSKVCQAWIAEHAGMTVIKSELRARAELAVRALKADLRVSRMLDSAQTQVMALGTYRDPSTGIKVPVKALLDIVPDRHDEEYGKCLADLKTCRTASPRVWARQCFTFGYHIQAAWYLDLYVAAKPEDRTDWMHILSENVPPFTVGRRLLSSEMVELGRRSYQQGLRDYCRALATGVWPGWDDGPGTINGWSLVQEEAWMLEDLGGVDWPELPKTEGANDSNDIIP